MNGPGVRGQRGLGHGWTRGVWPEGSGPWLDQGCVARGVWAMDGLGVCGQKGLGHGWTSGVWLEGSNSKPWMDQGCVARRFGGKGLVGHRRSNGGVARWI